MTVSTPVPLLLLVLGLVLPYASHAFLGSQVRNLPSVKQLIPRANTAGVSQLAAAATTAAASSSAVYLGSSSNDDPEAFDWWKQWYPVALTRDLDSAVPTKVTLLGRDMVLWKEGPAAAAASGSPAAWRCFIDRCPHRMAPLSEGRVESKTGNLQCAYHGWEFGGSGACSKIPQADPDADQSEAVALRSKRACATALPTQEAQGMIWVWPDTSEEGLVAAKVVKPTLMEDVDEKAMSYLVVCRDMPVRHVYLFRGGRGVGLSRGNQLQKSPLGISWRQNCSYSNRGSILILISSPSLPPPPPLPPKQTKNSTASTPSSKTASTLPTSPSPITTSSATGTKPPLSISRSTRSARTGLTLLNSFPSAAVCPPQQQQQQQEVQLDNQ